MLGTTLEAPVFLCAWITGIGLIQKDDRDMPPHSLAYTHICLWLHRLIPVMKNYLDLQIPLLSMPTNSPYEHSLGFIFHHIAESETPGTTEYPEARTEVRKESRGDGKAPRSISPSLQTSPGSWDPPCWLLLKDDHWGTSWRGHKICA